MLNIISYQENKTTANPIGTIKMTDNKYWEEMKKLETYYVADEIT